MGSGEPGAIHAEPRLPRADPAILPLLARLVPTSRSATLLVQPETILRCHRRGFRLLWKRSSNPTQTEPRISAETITLIEKTAATNRLWGAERIRGELPKLDIRLAKRTIQNYLRRIQRPRPPSHRSSTFLPNHARETWAYDFLLGNSIVTPQDPSAADGPIRRRERGGGILNHYYRDAA
ncbi:MAG: hypothetical protein P8R42_24200 [Candidatus Binatia bacterium]|nr:hypothetical protein [Candidatus Binatia bacterium]